MDAHTDRTSRSRPVVTLAIVGVLLAVASFIVFNTIPDRVVGDVESIEASLSEPLPGPTASLPPATPATDPSEPPRTGGLEPNENSRLEQLALGEAPEPVRLVIDGISVDAPVEPYGINPRTGQMAVPRNVSDVAWYEYGPSPGEPGSAVLAAHVDLSGNKGVFYRLRNLELGDFVSVVYDDGTSAEFVVTARATYEKEDLPLDALFSRAGRSVLTLITCGGGFNESSRGYDSNVVVYAVPIDEAVEFGYRSGAA